MRVVRAGLNSNALKMMISDVKSYSMLASPFLKYTVSKIKAVEAGPAVNKLNVVTINIIIIIKIHLFIGPR